MTSSRSSTPPSSSGGEPALSEAEWVALASAQSLEPEAAPPGIADLAAQPALRTGDEVGCLDDGDRRLASLAPSRDLADILESRHSETAALAPLSRADLVTLLYRSARLIAPGEGEDGGPWSHRPSPSAGATHPFDLLVYVRAVQGLPEGPYVFAPYRVQLFPLAAEQHAYAVAVESAATEAARRSSPAPVTVCLIANVHRVRRRYSAPLTLLLRDAGALLTVMHLVATDLGLNSSIVGIAGQVPADSPGKASSEAGPLVVSAGGLVVGGGT